MYLIKWPVCMHMYMHYTLLRIFRSEFFYNFFILSSIWKINMQSGIILHHFYCKTYSYIEPTMHFYNATNLYKMTILILSFTHDTTEFYGTRTENAHLWQKMYSPHKLTLYKTAPGINVIEITFSKPILCAIQLRSSLFNYLMMVDVVSSH